MAASRGDTDDAAQPARDVDKLQHELDRFRKAAEQTLDQLEWAADLLASEGQHRIARAIRDNRSAIRRRMTG